MILKRKFKKTETLESLVKLYRSKIREADDLRKSRDSLNDRCNVLANKQRLNDERIEVLSSKLTLLTEQQDRVESADMFRAKIGMEIDYWRNQKKEKLVENIMRHIEEYDDGCA